MPVKAGTQQRTRTNSAIRPRETQPYFSNDVPFIWGLPKGHFMPAYDRVLLICYV